MRDRLGVGGSAKRVLARLLPPADGRLDVSRESMVQRDDFGMGLGVARELVDDHPRDPFVILLPPALE